MFNDLPSNNTAVDDVKNVKDDPNAKKGLLQSLHSLTFSDDDDDNLDLSAKKDDISAAPTNTPSVNSGPTMGPSIGPSFTAPSVSKDDSTVLKNTASENKSVNAPASNMPNPFSAGPAMNTSNSPLYDAKSSAGSDNKPKVTSTVPSNKKDTPFNLNDLADPTVTFDTIENSLAQEMRRSIDSVKVSSQNIKSKANYELITSFGVGAKEVVVFNTFLTKEMPYTSKSGKSGTQRVNFFGLMTERGVYSIRVSSALTSKLEDALKHTTDMRDDTVGLLGEGTSRRFVLKLPAEDYGPNNVLYVPLVGDIATQNPETFTGLDAVEVDMPFIEDLMGLAVSEVDAMLDFEKRRRANLKSLQDKKDVELRKANIISDKLSSLSL